MLTLPPTTPPLPPPIWRRSETWNWNPTTQIMNLCAPTLVFSDPLLLRPVLPKSTFPARAHRCVPDQLAPGETCLVHREKAQSRMEGQVPHGVEPGLA